MFTVKLSFFIQHLTSLDFLIPKFMLLLFSLETNSMSSYPLCFSQESIKFLL